MRVLRAYEEFQLFDYMFRKAQDHISYITIKATDPIFISPIEGEDQQIKKEEHKITFLAEVTMSDELFKELMGDNDEE